MVSKFEILLIICSIHIQKRDLKTIDIAISLMVPIITPFHKKTIYFFSIIVPAELGYKKVE
jgi:hypothetical protein